MNDCGLSFLKKACLALCLGMILQQTSVGQCNNNLATRTYDTSLVSNGFNIFSLSFPKWSPDSGLLVSVKMAAEVSSQYGFTLRNADAQPATFQLTIGQQDQFVSPQMLAPFTSIYPQQIGSYPLSAGESTTQAPFTFLDKHVASDSITAVAPFLGTGQVSINYMAFTYTILSTINNATYYYGASISNKMRFSLQYLYCKGGGVLATNLTRWSALVQNSRTVQLDWSVVNETPNRQYHIQRSSDGQSFTTIHTLPAMGAATAQDYTWTDQLPDGASSNYYYRLEMIDNGSTLYSTVRQVTLPAEGRGIQVYPNPATGFINLATGQETAGDWQIDILSATGSLIQRETAIQARTIHLNFHRKMSAGTYFVRARNLREQKSFATSFIVTGEN